MPPPICLSLNGAYLSQSFSPIYAVKSTIFIPRCKTTLGKRFTCRALAQQVGGGTAATYAKEMERLSAKESLLLAFKDSGGFDALVTCKVTELQKIDVNERITNLERLNPTPRPTSSPYLEGRWNFEWFGSGSPSFFALRFFFERFPSDLARLSRMDALIKDGKATITARMKLLSTMESKLTLSSKLTVEGPLRMREEYAEWAVEPPSVVEEAVPEQLKGALGQALTSVQQLPVPVRDAISNGLKIPLTGTFQRLFMISYLDEEILILRDAAGVPEVLSRLDAPESLDATIEYES